MTALRRALAALADLGRARPLGLLLALGVGLAGGAAAELTEEMLGVDPATLPAEVRALTFGSSSPAPAPDPAPEPPAARGLRIMINIPSRRLRVYRGQARVMDVAMAIGRLHYPGETGNTRTRIGSYRITSWHRDYRSRSYPVPYSRDVWRGVFGPYTAKLGPRASYQYIHGTAGPAWMGDWLVEKREPPVALEGHVEDLFGAERGLSHGCTRIPNDDIERLWELAPVGTPVEKFYCLRERIPAGSDDDGEPFYEEVEYPNVYRYRTPGDPVFYPATGELVGYRHPPDAKGPR